MIFAALALGVTSKLIAEVPRILNYQGRVLVDGQPFNGTGYFKFALIDRLGETAYWSHDHSLEGKTIQTKQPHTAISLNVVNGLYSVSLGDDAIENMDSFPIDLFTNEEIYLRVWFNDDVNGYQLLSPDRRVASVGYAITSGSTPLAGLYAPPSQPVISWGANGDGQAKVPSDLGETIQIATGSSHSLAVMKNGSVRSWGRNDFGQSTVPDGLLDIIKVAAGGAHSLALKRDGTVVAWGSQGSPQSSPPQGLSGVRSIAAGMNHSLALKEDGTVVAFGDNTFLQLEVPGSATDVIEIAAGDDHCLALRADGTVIAWGRNSANQCNVPSNLADVVVIAAGSFHSLAARADGSVEAWGWNSANQTTVPDDLTQVVEVAGGYSHSLALKSDGSVVAWGDNASGKTDVPGRLANVISISAGAHHNLSLRASRVPAELASLDGDNRFHGRVGIGRTPSVNQLEVEGQASKSIAGNWSSNSDRRIKMDILPVRHALKKIQQVRLVSFSYTNEYRSKHPGIIDQRYLNVIAQEFAEVFPDHVRPSGEFLADGSEILQVDTYPLTIYTAAAVQELNQQVTKQNSELAVLKAQLAEMKMQIEKLGKLARQIPKEQ